jgi:hypothetical protein
MDYFKVIVENVLPIIVTILAPILVVLAKRLIVYLERKWDFTISDINEAKLIELIEGAIDFAEEKALQAAKTDPEKLPDGAKKLEMALEFAASQVERMGWDEWASEELAKLIESKLYGKRSSAEIEEKKAVAKAA